MANPIVTITMENGDVMKAEEARKLAEARRVVTVMIPMTNGNLERFLLPRLRPLLRLPEL